MTTPPPAHGVRPDWQSVPKNVRAAIETWLGSPIVKVASQQSGFSPGVAARLRTADDRGVFVKIAGPIPNADLPKIFRRELRITSALPTQAPVPRLLWSYDENDWVVLAFEEIDGYQPAQPWRDDELSHMVDALIELSDALTPSPLHPPIVEAATEKIDTDICGWRLLCDETPPGLDAWSLKYLDSLAKLEESAGAAVAGDTLIHLDVRADNVLFTSEKVWFVDWPHACVGAAWVDILFFAPSVKMQGGPAPEDLIMRHPAVQKADPAAITAAVCTMTGFFTHRALQPPPPGLPTVRAFQAAQGVVAREWLAFRAGWT
jgi:phosphotransferase family enzyme